MKIGKLNICLGFLVFCILVGVQTVNAQNVTNQPTQAKAQKALTSQGSEKPVTTDVRKGGILLKQNKLNVSVQEGYAHYSSNNIYIQGFSILPVLVVGEISVQSVKRDIFTTTLSTKYGILNNFELGINVPYLYGIEKHANATANPPWEQTKSGSGLGDISAALYYQPVEENASLPAIMLGLTGKSRTGRSVFDVTYNEKNIPNKMVTGSGFYGLRGSVSFVKTSDPVVIFGTVGYMHNFSRHNVNISSGGTSKLVNINPGDTISFNAGTSYALNYKMSINVMYQQAYTISTKENGKTIVNSSVNSAVLQFGTNWAYSKNKLLSFNVGAGLTPDSPDMTLNLIFSYTF